MTTSAPIERLSLAQDRAVLLQPNIDESERWTRESLEERVRRMALDSLRVSLEAPKPPALIAWPEVPAPFYYEQDAFFRRSIQDLARTAREMLDQPMQSFFKVMGWGILAQYYVSIGDLGAAQTAFGNSQTNDVWLGAVTMSEYLLARGEYGEAARLSEREVAHRRQLGYIQPLPGLLYVQARSVRALGKTEQALELQTQARVAAEKISHRRLLWQIYSLLSEMERERGNIPEAERFQAKAREVLDFIVDHTPPELRASFLAQPAVHAIMDTQ